MKLIIDIDEETYNRAKNPIICGMNDRLLYQSNMKEAIVNGIPYEERPQCDLISREYVEGIVEELENICINGDEYILALLSNIKNAPPVTPQPKSGHWVEEKK